MGRYLDGPPLPRQFDGQTVCIVSASPAVMRDTAGQRGPKQQGQLTTTNNPLVEPNSDGARF
jgi:hypothetical protein